jgi:uncharacterized membrane protein (Fun14 family)
MSILENLGSTAATIGGGFFVCILVGYALKKVIKIVAVIVGLFLAGLAYLQYHQIANINWNKLQTVSEGAITTLSIEELLCKQHYIYYTFNSCVCYYYWHFITYF